MKALDKREEFRAGQTDMLRSDIVSRQSTIAADGGADVTNPLIQKGRSISTKVMIQRLLRMNPDLRFEVANADSNLIGIYVVENRPDPVTNTSPWKRHICGMPNGEISEFYVPITIEAMVPDPDLGPGQVKTVEVQGQIPGWRSILLRLIRDGQITPAQAEAEFKVSQGRSSQRWQSAFMMN